MHSLYAEKSPATFSATDIVEEHEQHQQSELAQHTAIATKLQDIISVLDPNLPSKAVVLAAYDVSDDVRRLLLPGMSRAKKKIQAANVGPPPTLLDLPSEIRNYIWGLCVICHYPSTTGTGMPLEIEPRSIRIPLNRLVRSTPMSRFDRAMERKELERALQPAITKVNRQIRKEALSLFYSLNRFEVEVLHMKDHDRRRYCLVSRWLRAIGPENSRVLQRVEWRAFGSYYLEAEVTKSAKWFRSIKVPGHVVDEFEKQIGKVVEARRRLGGTETEE